MCIIYGGCFTLLDHLELTRVSIKGVTGKTLHKSFCDVLIFQFENQIQKSQAKMLKKMDKLKSYVKTLTSKTSKLEEMMAAMVRAQRAGGAVTDQNVEPVELDDWVG